MLVDDKRIGYRGAEYEHQDSTLCAVTDQPLQDPITHRSLGGGFYFAYRSRFRDGVTDELINELQSIIDEALFDDEPPPPPIDDTDTDESEDD